MSNVITVSALNQAVAQLLERNIALTWVSGEVSNFTCAASGHWYFTLKDSAAQVRSVMFRARAQYADFVPREGDKVEVRALVSLYAPRGEYQINVEAIRRAGVGNLFEAFLQLKARLDADGLFDVARKRALPAQVRCIGIVTSRNAAALRDVLITLRRRTPHVRVVLYPTPVQGEGAGTKIAQAIATASARAECDVLLICRGGGSIEDLSAFNEEIVARTIANCSMPCVSGVGHETDFTICDFVADVRAPTPTAAAELAAVSHDVLMSALQRSATQLQRAMLRQLENSEQRVDWLASRLPSPVAMLQARRTQLEHTKQSLRYAMYIPLQQAQTRFGLLEHRLRIPDLALRQQALSGVARRLRGASVAAHQIQNSRLQSLQAQLSLLSPQRTLERGYAVVRGSTGSVLRSTRDIKIPSTIVVTTATDSAEVGVSSLQWVLPS